MGMEWDGGKEERKGGWVGEEDLLIPMEVLC